MMDGHGMKFMTGGPDWYHIACECGWRAKCATFEQAGRWIDQHLHLMRTMREWGN
jgi:hypothetical protein